MAPRAWYGCLTGVVLLAAGLAVLAILNWDRSEIDVDGEQESLRQALTAEFGNAPEVHLTCLLPAVGEAPCLLDHDTSRREVALTFRNHALPEGANPEEVARDIVLRAQEASGFVQIAAKVDVIFEVSTDGRWAEVSRISRYSFSREALDLLAAPMLP